MDLVICKRTDTLSQVWDWHLVSRGHRCCSISYNVWDSLHARGLSSPQGQRCYGWEALVKSVLWDSSPDHGEERLFLAAKKQDQSECVWLRIKMTHWRNADEGHGFTGPSVDKPHTPSTSFRSTEVTSVRITCTWLAANAYEGPRPSLPNQNAHGWGPGICISSQNQGWFSCVFQFDIGWMK